MCFVYLLSTQNQKARNTGNTCIVTEAIYQDGQIGYKEFFYNVKKKTK